MMGKIVDAQEALEMGLVNRVASETTLRETTQSIVEALLTGGPEAVSATKSFLNTLRPNCIDQDLDTALTFQMEARTTTEAAEGMTAFLEKRPPYWQEESEVKR